MNKHKVTQAIRLGWHMEAARLQVIEAIEWDELAYAGTKWGYGLAYLKQVFPDPQDWMPLERSRAFWGWWKLQWYRREQTWLDHYRANPDHAPFATVGERGFSWLAMHKIEDLVESTELTDSWCRDLVPALKVA